MAISVLAHIGVLLIFLIARPSMPIFSADTPLRAVTITLSPPRPPVIPPDASPDPNPGSPSESAAATPAPPTAPTPPIPSPPAPRARPPRTPPPPDVEQRVTPPAPAATVPRAVGLTAGQLVGAAVAGAGSGSGSGAGSGSGSGSGNGSGGACDMIRRIQDAIRQDADIVAAATRAQATLPPAARALLVWNGDWVQTPGEAGRGLAGVRQAIALEIAFAPSECRRQSVTGLVLLDLGVGSAGPRIALGTDRWRWSDLTGAR